ncbi:zinc finger protein 26-like [Musca vetustissima]|uniref:zinc finger protein 26-like n=1 Tax=Musca vetustissima TaxID=27455 RepID=UPI002AB7C456|nr:zinc finger protein 26-like [Musca vetustissima]
MEDYIEYILCGEILASTSISSKDQYFLKCNECNGYYSTLDEFIVHHQSNHNDETLDGSQAELIEEENEEYLEIYSPLSVKSEQPDKGCADKHVKLSTKGDCENKTEIVEEGCADGHVKQSPKGDCENETDVVDIKSNSSPQHSKELPVDNCIKDEIDDGEGFKGFESEDMAADDDEMDPLEQSLGKEMEDQLNEEDNEYICSESEDEKNFMAFIEAYKKQPRLWNWKQYPSKFKTNKEREIYWSKISNDIKNNLNIDMTSSYVSAVIRRIRNGYAIKLNRLKSNEQRGGTLKSRTIPQWYFDKMQFLEPFLNNYSIVEIGAQRKSLESKQITQILQIYKRFPHLWNTNLVENVCTNKRNDALNQMIKTLKEEMSLQVDEIALKKYLYCIHGHFTTEKSKMQNQKSSSKDISMYYEHMTYLDEHVGPFFCSECNKKHKNPLQLKVHEALAHGLEPLKCPLCTKTYTNVQAYTFHARRHMNDTSEMCKICGKTFIKVVDLKAHMRGHNGIKPYFCEICGASFTMPSSLTEHKKRHDTESKEHCTICSKEFFSKRRLNMHLLTHSNERNFICNNCGKAFKTKKTMRAHETIHEDSRNHPCPVCGKMFKNRIGVTQHLRTHRNQAETSSNPFIDS